MTRSQIAVTPDIAYATHNGVAVSFDVYQPENANGAAVLFINSGGFVSGQLVQYTETRQSGYRFLEPNELTVQGAAPPIPLLAQLVSTGC